jgi:hypothetical protein
MQQYNVFHGAAGILFSGSWHLARTDVGARVIAGGTLSGGSRRPILYRPGDDGWNVSKASASFIRSPRWRWRENAGVTDYQGRQTKAA